MKRLACLVALALIAALLSVPAGSGASARPADPLRPPTWPAGSSVPAGDRDRVLPAGWRTSADLAWTTAGDGTGFHLLVAGARAGYAWRTAATLAEPGLDADSWVGNACVTGSGKRAVVVYAPRHFTNRAHLAGRGAFAAVVDLADGRVTKLAAGVSIAYHNPGCGAAETAVLTSSGAADLGRTRLHLLDAARGAIVRRHDLPGQLTSAVPYGADIAAARGGLVVGIAPDNKVRTLATTSGAPAYLHPDRDGGLAYLQREAGAGKADASAVVRYFRSGTVRELARGPVSGIGLAAGAGGEVYVTGSPARTLTLPRGVRTLPGSPPWAQVSTRGQATVSTTTTGAGLDLRAQFPATRTAASFQVDPAAETAPLIDQGRRRSPVFGSARALAAGSSTDPVEVDRTCAVSRNDVASQVEQPHWKQVEWAANLAVQSALIVQRPANFRQSGLPAWQPQGMFPPLPLAGGGRVPAQVMLGVLAQESNLWQASWHALEGVPGNPLVGSYYGVANLWGINWAQADCGYGVAQVTDGMRLAGREKPGEVSRPVNQQRAIALDYATNIAAGLRILQDKWNQTRAAGITMNGGDPGYTENWFAAVWAYNSGMNPQATTGNTTGCSPGPSCTDSRGAWGLGWGNNPANPDYPWDRPAFLDPARPGSQDDARFPQRWPYPEKIMGWAASPIVKYDWRRPNDWEGGYAQAWWMTAEQRTNVRPSIFSFCAAAPPPVGNNCSITSTGNGTCMYADYHCWWHWPVMWKSDCAYECGHESVSYAPGAPEPDRGTHSPPACGTPGLPGGSLVVDDVPDSVGIVRADACPTPTTNRGTFGLTFSGASGLYNSKRDFHQIGSGLDGHYWFSHAYNNDDEDTSHVRVNGTWTLNQTISGWARVLVHLPASGGDTQQARYQINRGAGAPGPDQYRYRSVNQWRASNEWVPLGVFQFNGTPSVSLSNITRNTAERGRENIVWDAVAFQPLPGKPRNMVVALGDSYSSGEGASREGGPDYYPESAHKAGDRAFRNGCHRSREAWSRRAFLQDEPLRTIGARADAYDSQMDYHLLACSGAQTENLLPTAIDPTTDEDYRNDWEQTARGQSRDVSQLDRGYLDENTTLVSLTIGGNDLGWGDVIARCVLIPTALPCYEFTVDGQRIADRVPLEIEHELKVSVSTVIRAIAERAPNAKIVLMGYPELIEDDGGCLNIPGGNGITAAEAAWLNEQGYHVGLALRDLVAVQAAAGRNVRYADPINDFAGQAICGSPETIHGVVLTKAGGEDPAAVQSAQSFHPKISGTANYAAAFNRTLRDWGL